MARNIDPNRPFTEEEKAWLRTRAGGDMQIQVNERRFGHLSPEETEETRAQFDADAEADAEDAARRKQEEEEDFDEEDVIRVSGLKSHEVRAELKSMGIDAPANASAGDLKLALLEALEEAREGASQE